MMKNDSCIAELIGVTKVYPHSDREMAALNKVSLKANSGELILLLGPSGSGKTTLLTIIAGLQKPSSGEVFLFGKNVNEYTAADLQKMRAVKIGFIFQTFYLLDALNVLDNVRLVMQFAGISGKETRKRATEYLEKFGIGHLKNAYPSSLSQGEKQRVAVTRALINGARLIIADEPTGSLATKQGVMIVEFLKEMVVSEELCVIIASHDERIATYSDRVLQLQDGSLI